MFDSSGKSSGGSTDVGDVSWVVPVTGFTAATWVPGTPGHSWQAVACGGTTIGKKGMNLAARTLAATACSACAVEGSSLASTCPSLTTAPSSKSTSVIRPVTFELTVASRRATT